jgi:hypothetical protein
MGPVQFVCVLRLHTFRQASERLDWNRMAELSLAQMRILERLVSCGFAVVAFPLYANAVGIRKGGCAALLEPVASGGFHIYGEPCFLLDGNLSVRVNERGKTWFVWKKLRLEATPERLAELTTFVAELGTLL